MSGLELEEVEAWTKKDWRKASNEERVEAVSYTHLDVYKRQVMIKLLGNLLLKEQGFVFKAH